MNHIFKGRPITSCPFTLRFFFLVFLESLGLENYLQINVSSFHLLLLMEILDKAIYVCITIMGLCF